MSYENRTKRVPRTSCSDVNEEMEMGGRLLVHRSGPAERGFCGVRKADSVALELGCSPRRPVVLRQTFRWPLRRYRGSCPGGV